MDNEESKSYKSRKNILKDLAKKHKLKLSTKIKIAALISAGLLSVAYKNHKDYIQLNNFYTEELSNIQPDIETANIITTRAIKILNNLEDDSFEKTHSYLVEASNELISGLCQLHTNKFSKYFEGVEEDLTNNQIIAIKINKTTKDLINPNNQSKNSYYLVCNNHYIEANDIESAVLEANLRELVYNNKEFSDKKMANFKKELSKYASEISYDKLKEVSIFDNKGKFHSFDNEEINQKLEEKEKLENNNLANALFHTSESKQEYLENVRTSSINNLPKISNINITDQDDPNLHEPIRKKSDDKDNDK